MKTQNLVLRFILTFAVGVGFIVMVMMVFSSCKNEPVGTPGNVQLKATTPKLMLKSGTLAAAGGATIKLDAALVEIKNLRIEENSGNDVQNQSGNQSGDKSNDGKEAAEKNSTAEGGDQGDILLPGPYSLDIISGSAAIDQVSVQPGTYKKVDFNFSAGTGSNGHSITLSGVYTNAQGVAVPFMLTSDFAGTVQLPLAGNGLQVNSGTTSSISILFDDNNWLNALDLSTATVSNGQININATANKTLYEAFVSALSQHIEIE